MMKLTIGVLAAALMVGSAGSAFALQPVSSPSFRINYAAVAPGGSALSGTTFNAPTAAVGQNLTRLQSSQQLPVSLSGFLVE